MKFLYTIRILIYNHFSLITWVNFNLNHIPFYDSIVIMRREPPASTLEDWFISVFYIYIYIHIYGAELFCLFRATDNQLTLNQNGSKKFLKFLLILQYKYVTSNRYSACWHQTISEKKLHLTSKLLPLRWRQLLLPKLCCLPTKQPCCYITEGLRSIILLPSSADRAPQTHVTSEGKGGGSSSSNNKNKTTITRTRTKTTATTKFHLFSVK